MSWVTTGSGAAAANEAVNGFKAMNSITPRFLRLCMAKTVVCVDVKAGSCQLRVTTIKLSPMCSK